MYRPYLRVLGAVLALAGCTPHVQTDPPTPRPWGHDLPVYQAPLQPPEHVLPGHTAPEPAGVLTLPQALALALLYNPQLAAFAWEIRASEARTLQAGLIPNPTVSLEVEDFAGSGELRGLQATEITIHLSQLLEVAGKRRKRTRVAALERDLAAWEYEATRLAILTQVTQRFVEVLSAQERLRLQAELVRLAERALATVAERVKAGKVSPVEETRARVALATSRIARDQAQRTLDAARTRLVATWDGQTAAFHSVTGHLDAVASIPSIEALAEHMRHNPEIARWATAIAQRQAAVALEKARRIPDPILGGGVRHARATGDSALVMQVSIPLPVFDRNQGGWLEARYRLAKAGEEQRAAIVQVRAALADAYAMLSSALIEVTGLRHDVLPGAQQAFEAASEGYRQGKFGFLDVLDAQRTLFEARGQYVEALAAYHKAVSEVERLIGAPLGTVPATPTRPQNGERR